MAGPHQSGEMPHLSAQEPLISHPGGYFFSLPQARQLQLSTDLNEPPEHWLRANYTPPAGSPSHGTSTAQPGHGTSVLSAQPVNLSRSHQASSGEISTLREKTSAATSDSEPDQPSSHDEAPLPCSSSSPLEDFSTALVPLATADVLDSSYVYDLPARDHIEQPVLDPCVLQPTLYSDKVPPSFGKVFAAVPTDMLGSHGSEVPDMLDPPNRFLSSDLPPTSTMIAEAHPDAVGKVDIIGSSEVIKSLLKAPYSNGPLSLAVHRVDRTLLIDTLDLNNLNKNPPGNFQSSNAYPAPPPRSFSGTAAPGGKSSETRGSGYTAAATTGTDSFSKSEYRSDGLLGVVQEAVRADGSNFAPHVLQPAKKDSAKARGRKLLSKFIAHSVVSHGEDYDSAPDSDTETRHASESLPSLGYDGFGSPLGVSASALSLGGTGPVHAHPLAAATAAAASHTVRGHALTDADGNGSGSADPVRRHSITGPHSASAIEKWKIQHEELMSGKYSPKPAAGKRSDAASMSSSWSQQSSRDQRAVVSSQQASRDRQVASSGSTPPGESRDSLASGQFGGEHGGAARCSLPASDSSASVSSAVQHENLDADTSISSQQEHKKPAAGPCSVPLKPRPTAVGSFGMAHVDSGLTSSSTIFNMGWQWPFKRHVEWVFKDLRMLLGTNMPIFGCGKYPAVSLKLVDLAQRIDVLTGIDYWLDNLMCGVPDLVMCFHLNGVVKGYNWHKTMDLPDLAQSKFNPELVSDVANNIYNFLYRTTAQEGHTYWLFKDRDEDLVRVYDLTAICFRKPGGSTADNPYTIPVAMLLYRTAKYWMVSQASHMTLSRLYDVFALLKNTVRLLQGDTTCPEVQVSALFLLSTICLNQHDTVISPGSPILVISPPCSKVPAEAEMSEYNLSPPSSPLFDDDDDDGVGVAPDESSDAHQTARETFSTSSRDPEPAGTPVGTRKSSSLNTVVESINLSFLLDRSKRDQPQKNKRESPPLPNADERIKQSIDLIEEGLQLLTEWHDDIASTLANFTTDATDILSSRPAVSAFETAGGDNGNGVTSAGNAEPANGTLNTATTATPTATSTQSLDLAELLRQHAEKPDDTALPLTAISKRKAKKKRAAKKAAAKDPGAGDPTVTPISTSGSQGEVGNANVEEEPDYSQQSLATNGVGFSGLHDGDSGAVMTAGLAESDSPTTASCSAGKVSTWDSHVQEVNGAEMPATELPPSSGDGVGDSPPHADSHSRRRRSSSDLLLISLRLDQHGTVHEGVCPCRQPWYIHATLLLCNQAGLALHGLASDSLQAKHTGRALRYLNTACACFLVGERLATYLCGLGCPEMAGMHSYSANIVAVMALKVRAFDELISDQRISSVPKRSFDLHAEEYFTQTTGERVTAWVKAILPNQSCFHPAVLTNDMDIISSDIRDLCVCLIQTGRRPDIPTSLAKTCVKFAAQSCCDFGLKELLKIKTFLAQAYAADGKDSEAFSANITAAKAIISSGELSSLKMATDALEDIGEQSQASVYRLNMANCLLMMSIVEYPSFFILSCRHHTTLPLAQIKSCYAAVLTLIDGQSDLHDKNAVYAVRGADSKDSELCQVALFNQFFILVVKAFFMLAHVLLEVLPLDHEIILKLLHSAEVKLKASSDIVKSVRGKRQHRMVACLIHIGRAVVLLEMMKVEGVVQSTVTGRKKSSTFKQTKFQEELKLASEFLSMDEDPVLRGLLIGVEATFTQLCLASTSVSPVQAYQLCRHSLLGCTTILPVLEAYLRTLAAASFSSGSGGGSSGGDLPVLGPLVGCDGRAVLLVFFSLLLPANRFVHDGAAGGLLCRLLWLRDTMLDTLQKLARLQAQCKNVPSNEPEWKALYRDCLMTIGGKDFLASGPREGKEFHRHLAAFLSALVNVRKALQ